MAFQEVLEESGNETVSEAEESVNVRLHIPSLSPDQSELVQVAVDKSLREIVGRELSSDIPFSAELRRQLLGFFTKEIVGRIASERNAGPRNENMEQQVARLLGDIAAYFRSILRRMARKGVRSHASPFSELSDRAYRKNLARELQPAMNRYRFVPVEAEQQEGEKKERVEKVANLAYGGLDWDDVLRADAKGVGALYKKVQLSDAALRCERNRDKRGFRQRTKRGIFVYGFNETPRNAKGEEKDTVMWDMYKNLMAAEENDADEGEYVGRCLRDEKGIIRAYLTAELPPPPDAPFYSGNREKISRYQQKLLELYTHGFTGGGLRLRQDMDWADLEYEVLHYPIMNFDTICTDPEYPDAGKRLIALFMAEVRSEHPHVKKIKLFRIKAARIEPRVEYGDLVGLENTSSGGFFTDRHCENFADDWNPDGFASTRILDGLQLRIIPAWEWMDGDVPEEVAPESIRLWVKLLRKYRVNDQVLPSFLLQKEANPREAMQHLLRMAI